MIDLSNISRHIALTPSLVQTNLIRKLILIKYESKIDSKFFFKKRNILGWLLVFIQ